MPALAQNPEWIAHGCSNGCALSAPNCTRACSSPLLDRKAAPEVHAWTLAKGLSRLDYLNSYLGGREFLLDHFSVADAYLVTVINWTMATPPVDLAKWPAIKTYYERLRERPSVAKAIAEEFELFKAELARHKAAA